MNKLALVATSLLAGFVVAQVCPVSALENAANGKVLAQTWCASCHLVSPDQTKGSADVPPFASLAKRTEAELDKLSGFLAHPHPVMPDMQLTHNEIADIVAYIRTLK